MIRRHPSSKRIRRQYAEVFCATLNSRASKTGKYKRATYKEPKEPAKEGGNLVCHAKLALEDGKDLVAKWKDDGVDVNMGLEITLMGLTLVWKRGEDMILYW